jgi:16S rRNA (cytidine1402-2'-O)-methyltransferase
MNSLSSPLWFQHLNTLSARLMDQNLPGGAYLVATPIGNIFDITVRALHVLGQVEGIAAEDTRRTRILLRTYGLAPPLWSYHEHNWRKVLPLLIAHIRSGKRLALVSDAGTPLISDPGFRLVQQCLEENLAVFALPGPCAAIAALTLSGLAPAPFHFFGFLPAQAQKRRGFLQELRLYPGTLVFFESPQRLLGTLQDALEVLGDRSAVIARELTKKFEEVRRASLGVLRHFYEGETPPKGEIVLLIAGAPKEASSEDPKDLLQRYLMTHSLKEAVLATQRETGLARSTLYQLALTLKKTS